MKAKTKRLIVIATLAMVAFYAMKLAFLLNKGYYTVAEFKLPNGERLIITTDIFSEIAQPYLFNFGRFDRDTDRILFASSEYDEHRPIQFKSIVSSDGGIVAIVEEHRPDILLLLLDLTKKRSTEEMVSILERETHQKFIHGDDYWRTWRADDPNPPRVTPA